MKTKTKPTLHKVAAVLGTMASMTGCVAESAETGAAPSAVKVEESIEPATTPPPIDAVSAVSADSPKVLRILDMFVMEPRAEYGGAVGVGVVGGQ
jgi:hypothetical protein